LYLDSGRMSRGGRRSRLSRREQISQRPKWGGKEKKGEGRGKMGRPAKKRALAILLISWSYDQTAGGSSEIRTAPGPASHPPPPKDAPPPLGLGLQMYSLVKK